MLLADSALSMTSDVLEQETLDVLRAWYKSLGKTFWAVGPPNPLLEDVTLAVSPSSPCPDEEAVLTFLDRIQTIHGEKSLIFVRNLSTLAPECFILTI
jgi:hypothetical protein